MTRWSPVQKGCEEELVSTTTNGRVSPSSSTVWFVATVDRVRNVAPVALSRKTTVR
jgi:hypothetical protein